MILLDVVVGVPLHISRAAAGNDADKSHTILDESPREQTAASVVIGGFASDSVQIKHLLSFLAKVKHFRCLCLHPERQVIGVDTRGERDLGPIP